VHSLRETQRTGRARKIIGTRLFYLPFSSLADTRIASKNMAAAAHHRHLETLPHFLPILARHAQWVNTELATASVVANLGHSSSDGMVKD